nr:uncharacterized protein LOC128698080 isoform X2 [Cherax quadricarinatus]
MSKGNLVGMVTLDLQKAFDTVNHNILCKKLQAIGIGSVDWFKSYLSNRRQIVKINKTESEPLPITCGVPQGSILGPLLFLCYVNDMPISVKCKLLLYADDSALLVTGKDPQDIANVLTLELESCSKCRMLRCVVMVMMVVAANTAEDGEGDTTPSSSRSSTFVHSSLSFSPPPYLPSTAAPSSLSSTSPPSSSSSTDGSGDSLVWTQLGWVTGVQETSTKGRNFYSYYSIPYAKPPLGKLRFKDPVEGDPWKGVRVGSREPPPCLQIPFHNITSGDTQLIGQEDCLYLNVFTGKPNRTEAGLPVLVFIHGGAYFADSTTHYPPHVLLNEDIVLVTLQYRLGILGFLSTEDEVMPGNQGLKDQALALRWVKTNVRQFGGDPEKITIFGESAGGGCVHFQILSPKTDGLFARAILQSGSAICPRSLGDAHKDVAYHTAAVVGCHQWDSYELLQCLQEARAEELILTLPKYFQWRYLPLLLGPRVDGDFLPDDPEVLARDGRHKKVDIISGIMSHDGGSFVNGMYDREEVRKSLQERFSVLGPVAMSFKCTDVNPLLLTLRIFDRYLGGMNLDQADPDDVMKMFTDRHFAVCHDLTAILHSRNSIDPLAHTSSHQPNHQPCHQTSHQPSHQTSHQPSYQSNHQPSHQPCHQASHQANHQASHQANHQASHQTSHQPSHQASHQANHQANHQASHQTSHQTSHQASHQANHQASHQTSHQPSHQFNHQPSHQPKTYTFELQYRGERSFTDRHNLTFGKHWVTHSDDLIYLFNSEEFELTRPADLALRDLFTKLWTNFADTGNPTPDSSLGFIWEPTREAHLQHLVLSPSPFMQNDTRHQLLDRLNVLISSFWTF